MTKRYDFHKYLPSINDVVLVGDKRLKELRIEYKLKEGPHIKIVDGGTEEKPDPKHPVINVQPEGWEYENEYNAFGEKSPPPSLKLVSSDGKTKIVGENFYVYEAGEDYEGSSEDFGEDGVWIMTYFGSI